jgi:hypothetical protein
MEGGGEKDRFGNGKVKGIGVKGIGVKGIGIKGVGVKGIGVKGIGVKGVGVKGIRVKGIRVKGIGVKGIGVKGVAVKKLNKQGSSVLDICIHLNNVDFPAPFLPTKPYLLVGASTRVASVSKSPVPEGWGKLKLSYSIFMYIQM